MVTGIKVGAEVIASDHATADSFDVQNSLRRHPLLFPLGDRVRGHADPLRQLLLRAQICENTLESRQLNDISKPNVVVHMKDFLHYGLRKINRQFIADNQQPDENQRMVDTPRPEHFSAFKDWLEAVRLSRGLTKASIAEVAGKTPQAATKWFKGGDVEPESLKKIADWAGAPYEHLRMLLDGQSLNGRSKKQVVSIKSPIVQRVSRKVEQLAEDEASISAVEALVDSLIASASRRHTRKGVK